MTTIIDLTNLGDRGFVITGGRRGDLAGYSVTSEGDINKDGIRDMVVGAPRADSDGEHVGKAYVLFGHPGAFGPIDLGHLSPADGFAIIGESGGDEPGLFGLSVSKGGDFDGDGYDEFIVGAPGVDGGAGAAYLIYGKAGGFADISLDSLARADGFKMSGAAGSHAGYSVSQAGDVNGDRLIDMMVGAPDADGGAGAVYVLFGRAEGYDGVDLANLSSADGVTILGATVGDQAGFCVSGGSDINDDQISDMIIGAPYADDAGADAGLAYVILGRRDGFGADNTIDLANLSPEIGFTIRGDAARDLAGIGVSKAGDINADGYKDLMIGASGADGGGSGAGAVYVLFGKAGGFADLDLADLSPEDGFVIQGDAKGDAAGFSVSATGDMNGDGFNEMIIGAMGGDDGGRGAGEAYVIYGKASGFGPIDLANLADADGFVIQGDRKGDGAGFAVSGAGDVDGDGFSDVFVGAPYNDDGGPSAGNAYVIFGAAPTEDVVRIGTAIANLIFGGSGDDVLEGRGGNDELVAAAGDDRVEGQGGDDNLDGGEGNDAVLGGAGDDVMHGRDGDDALSGGRGVDDLYGGAGQDRMSGGAGADLFHFTLGGTSADALLADRIADFSQAQHDVIDLSAYDADPRTRPVDAFAFVGDAAFSGAVGELRFEFSGRDTLVSGDTDGDKVADFAIQLTGTIALTGDDFLFAAGATVGGTHPFLTPLDHTTNQFIQLA